MRIGDVVRFQEEHFFNGAVQLGWVRQQPALAAEVAGTFVFHGPRYHGTSDGNRGELASAYRLKDTASFVLDLLRTTEAAHCGREVNPFWLAIAGYGSGKSHLSVTLAELLMAPDGPVAEKIMARLDHADREIATEVNSLLSGLEHPMLVLPVDGSSRFHLGNMVSQTIFAQLERAGVSADPIRALSPRFQTAEHFCERNFSFRTEAFAERLPGHDAAAIRHALRHQDEDTFDRVNAIYLEANGHPIPIEGQESAQALLETLVDEYCGNDGPFSHILILFDELGLYLEHAAEHPERAGARALQEIFQGVQDNPARVQFIGFIQYELKAYLQRFGTSDLRHLQRYLTRFDAAEKFYLSSNLETVFAHMIHKDEAALDALWNQANADRKLQQTWQRLAIALPGFSDTPTWQDENIFKRVIARGCWPLHPMAVWLLTRQSDLIQQRSALAFVKEVTGNLAEADALVNGGLRQVSSADLLHDFLLEQYAAVDQAPGGLIETLLHLLDKHTSLLDRPMRLVMSGVAVLDKIRVGRRAQETVNILLAEATALPQAIVGNILEKLSSLGALEWNPDLGQYELLSDGASRGQFQQWLRAQRQSVTRKDVRQLFLRRGVSDCELLNPIQTDFGKRRQISTPDWRFEATAAHSDTIEQAIAQAIDHWSHTVQPNDAKGRVIYLYLDDQNDPLELDSRIRNACAAALEKAGTDAAPVLVVGLQDGRGHIAEALARLTIIEERIGEADRERFRRFIGEELETTRIRLRSESEDAIRARRYWVAGVPEPSEQPMRKTALEIFAQIYRKAPPFPFDGFSTARGNGPGGVATLSRALVTHQVNQVWIPAQPAVLRNRMTAVLRDSWRALNKNNEPCEPKDEQLRALYDLIQQAHEADPERSLLTSCYFLIAPPWGMNAASATLLISLLIGLRSPQRQLFFDGNPISNIDWITKAIPGTGRYFVEAVLGRTSIRFFDEDTEARWIRLLNTWEAETRLDRIVMRGREIDTQRAAEQFPPSLAERLVRLEIAVKDAQGKLSAMKNGLSQFERELEKAVTGNSLYHCLQYAYKIAKAREELLDETLWPPEMARECDRLVGFAQEVIDQELASGWIARQNVHNVTDTSSFRTRTESEARWMRELGYRQEAEQLERHAQHALFHVEERQRHALTLAEAEDYPRQPAPRGGEPIVILRNEEGKGQSLIEALRGIKSLSEAERQAHINAITRRLERVRAVIGHHESELADLYIAPIRNEEQLRESIARVEQLRTIFSGDRNGDAIDELAKQLHRIQQNLSSWEQGDLPAERLDSVLHEQAKSQLEAFAHFIDAEEMDPPPWDLQTLYGNLVEERVALAKQRSAEWLHPRLMLETEIPRLDLDRIRQFKAEVTGAPGYLAESDCVALSRLRAVIDSRLQTLEAEERDARVSRWQAGFPALEAAPILDRSQVERLLVDLKSPPAVLDDEEERWRETLRERLTRRLDEISLDDLISRVQRLSPALRAQLLERIASMS